MSAVKRMPSPGALRRRTAPGAGAGRLLQFATVLPVLAVTGWLLVAVPLAALGAFHRWTVLPAAVISALVLLKLARPALLAVRVRPAPWWASAATLAIAVAFAAVAVATHSEQAVLHRDAGTYAQIGLWLSGHPGLTSPVPADAFGTAADEVTFAHPGFYERDGRIVPQFMTGWPTLLAAAHWFGGWTGMFMLPGLIGGLAVLAVAGLAARVAGPRWAPVAALLLAAAWPMLRVSQTTYSEPLAALMLAGGLALLLDGWRGRRPMLLGLAGLVLAGGELVRLDMGVDFALVLPALGWWWLRRQPGVLAFAAGAAVGGGLGYLDARYVTWPYVQVNWESARLMVALLLASAGATVLGVLMLRTRRTTKLDPHGTGAPVLGNRRAARLDPHGTGAPALENHRSPDPRGRGAPVLENHRRPGPRGTGAPVLGSRRTVRLDPRWAVALVVAGGLLLAARPWIYTDRSITAVNTMDYVASHQERLGLPVDGARGYAEQSLSWVAWYFGWPALVLAWGGLMAAVSGVLRGRQWIMLPVLLVYGGSAAATLLRPAITPDHPWADRRLVVEVLPAVVLLAVVALAGLARIRLRRPWLALLLVLAAGPALWVTVPLAPLRTEVGEPYAAAKVCRSLRPDDTVIMVDTQWAPTVRNQCGLPVAALPDPTVDRMRMVAAAVRAAGRDPVLLSTSTLPLLPYGLPLERVVFQDELEDQHQLVRRPDGVDPRLLECWLVRA
ncbi:hypothetical protein [Dactylosporangium sp. CS-033363]|uniref:hypothetical protein n=1 Tax=Dactylosporangium sp. CS-033363 TaxID=3239935 RepID=UPI003D8D0FCD